MPTTAAIPAPHSARRTVVFRISKRRTGEVSSDTTISEKRSINAPDFRGPTPNGFARVACPSRQHHLEQQLPEQDAIAGRQLGALRALAVQLRPVGAAEILDEEAPTVVADRGVGAGHGRLGDDDVGATPATYHHPIPVDRHFEALVEALQDPHGRARRNGTGGFGFPSDLLCHRWPMTSIS